MQKVNISEKLNLFNDHWHPRIVAELNGQHVKLVKVQGDFTWHSHELEDEMFLVLSGTLYIEFRDRTVRLDPQEFIVVPRGVEHRPYAIEECAVMLFEPASTINTGDRPGELTRNRLDSI